MKEYLNSDSTKELAPLQRRSILVVSDSEETIADIDNILSRESYETLIVDKSDRAILLLSTTVIDYVLIDANSIDMQCGELVRSLRSRAANNFVLMVILDPVDNEDILPDCMSGGCDDFIFKPFTSVTLNARIAAMEQVFELKELYKNSVDEQKVAKRILSYALDKRSIQLEQISLLSRSTGIFSGDLFLIARHPDGGLHAIIADFTGHGLSAAIGALPVADIFSAMTIKGFSLEDILGNINQKLHTLLPTSMYMACSILKIDSDLKHARIWNGGMPEAFIRDDKTGLINHTIRSTHIPLGIRETMHDNLEVQTIELSPDDQFILYTDGLIDTINSEGVMFGDDRLYRFLTSSLSNDDLFPALVDNFNKFCGDIELVDDVTLGCISCSAGLMEISDITVTDSAEI